MVHLLLLLLMRKEHGSDWNEPLGCGRRVIIGLFPWGLGFKLGSSRYWRVCAVKSDADKHH